MNPYQEHRKALRHYFEYSNSGVDVVEDGLKEVPFGEYLVETGRLRRDQLLDAMMLQDRNPGVRLGECIAALGYLPYEEVDRVYDEYARLSVVEC
ncbi:MAG: hypothetical protein D6689_20445 [Deltaproteobacteria bacterium]|nr:MAG: hypothetical protein D6689_20445 [Deltaproteobacteria bacterium]